MRLMLEEKIYIQHEFNVLTCIQNLLGNILIAHTSQAWQFILERNTQKLSQKYSSRSTTGFLKPHSSHHALTPSLKNTMLYVTTRLRSHCYTLRELKIKYWSQKVLKQETFAIYVIYFYGPSGKAHSKRIWFLYLIWNC